MYKYYQDGNKILVAGTVEKMQNIVKDGNKVVTITLSDFTNENIDIFFNNNESVKNADLVEKAKIKEGAYIAVLVRCSEDEKMGTGLAFKYKGMFTFKKEGKGYTNVILGTAIKPNSPRDNIFSVTIPVDVYENNEKKTIWYGVTFFDNEKKDNAKAAKKIIKNNNTTPVIVVSGPVKAREYQGKTYYSVVGYKIFRTK